MIIPKAAIEKFYARKRLDCSVWKDYSDAKLETIYAHLPRHIGSLWPKLRKHQKVCFLLGAIWKRFFFLNDTGTGKTLLALSLILYHYRMGRVKRVLILVPNKVNKTEWALEIQKHMPKMPFVVLEGASKEKWQCLQETDVPIYIETYDGFLRLACELTPDKKRDRDRLKPNAKAISWLRDYFQGLIGDESTELKNHAALPFRVCKQLVKGCNIVFNMTGTPFGRKPQDIWAQMFLIDNGETLGETLGLFRASFMREIEGFFGVEYEFDLRKKALFHKILSNRSIRYTANLCDLPAVTHIIKKLVLPQESRAYIERARQAIIDAKGNYPEMKNAFLRMRQISSGYLGYRDDETGERAEIEFDENPKLELLIALIKSLPQDRKAIVFHEFNYSGARICKELTKAGIGYLYLYGKTKDVPAVRKKFESGSEQVLVLSNASGWAGINLQVAQYGFYYESPVPVIMRRQTQARFVRQESRHDRVFLYDLLVKGTVDERILEFHKEGGDLFKALVEGKVTI